MRKLGSAALVAIAACGLVPTVREVEPGACELPGGRCDVELPAGWRHERTNDCVTVVCDHELLSQLMVYSRLRWRAFPATGKEAREDMGSAELAERALEETRALARKEGIREVEVLENRPVEVAGRPGVFLHLRIENSSGLPHDHLQAGFVQGDRYYCIWFRAPRIHYFERDRWAFDRAVETVRLRSSAGLGP